MDWKEFKGRMEQPEMDYTEFTTRLKAPKGRQSWATVALLELNPERAEPVLISVPGGGVTMQAARTAVAKAARTLGWQNAEGEDEFATVVRGEELWFCRLLPGDARTAKGRKRKAA